MSERRYRAVMIVLALLVVGAFTVSVGWGAVSIAPAQVAAVFLDKAGIATNIDVSPVQASVLWSIRVPRTIMALVVGVGLAVSGIVLQGVFRNPLAEPSLLGVSGGAVAASMTATVVVSRLAMQGVVARESAATWAVPLAGAFGAFVILFALYRFFRRGPRRDVTTFILVGVIMNVILSAVIAMLPAVFRDGGLGNDTTFWTMGGLGSTVWPSVYVAVPVALGGAFLLSRMAPQLNLLALGDTDAEYLGVDTHQVRVRSLLLAAVTAGAAVAFAGVVAFVGLVVPHALRAIIGPDHRRLLPAGALGGAFMVTTADVLARTLVSPVELPIGVLTTLVGGPLFFWLLARERSKGRWAMS